MRCDERLEVERDLLEDLEVGQEGDRRAVLLRGLALLQRALAARRARRSASRRGRRA